MGEEGETRPFSWQESTPTSPIDFESVPWPTSSVAAGVSPNESQVRSTLTRETSSQNSTYEYRSPPWSGASGARRTDTPTDIASLSSIAERTNNSQHGSGTIPIKLDTNVPALQAYSKSRMRQSSKRPLQSPSSAASAPLTPRSESFLRSKFHVAGDDGSATKSSRSSIIPSHSTTSTPDAEALSMPSRALPGTPSVLRPHRDQLPRLQSPPPPPPPRKDTPPVTSPSNLKSASSSLLSRMGTRAAGRLQKQSRYHKLDDDQAQGGDIALDNVSRSRASSGPSFLPPGFDLSSFEGPGVPPVPQLNVETTGPDSDHDNDNENDILEAKGHLTGGIGRGMSRVKSTRLAVPDTTPQHTRSPSLGGWIRRKSSATPEVKRPGQRHAEVTGQVVAVEEEDIQVDLSNVEGRTGVHTVTTDLDLMAGGANKQSYYFPPDPQMPNWRPFSMSNWYILLLISIAFALAGVQEYLVQLSRIWEPEGKSLLTFVSSNEVSAGDWFVWKYLPEMILVTYGVMFQATDFEVRRLEPYYQMSNPTGSVASESLNMDYLTFWSYLIPFKAFRHRQWAVVLSSIATILSSALVPILFSAALNMDPDRDERIKFPDKPKYVRMDPAWSRAMEAALLIVAISGIFLLYNLRRKSGLVSNPKGIAGISVMATKSHILNDFRGLDMASHTTIHRQLKHRRYILHKSSLWQGEYLTRSDLSDLEVKPQNPHPLALHLRVGILYIILLVIVTAFIPVVEFTAATKLTSVLPWFLTALSTLIKLAWTNLETAIRMIEPFYVLSRRHASPRVLLLDYTGTVPGYMPIKAAYNGHYLLACVGVCSILCEVLTVCVSSFNVDGRQFLAPSPDKDNHGNAETSKSYWVSVALALLIPATLSIVLVFVYTLRRHAFLPRQPGTIASILAFVAQSRMLYDFVAPDGGGPSEGNTAYKGGGGLNLALATPKSPGSVPVAGLPSPGILSRMTGFSTADTTGSAQRRNHAKTEEDVAVRTVRRLEQHGKTYGLGWYKGRDGIDHLGVDEEELLASYHHGVDWSKGRLGLGEVGTWENY